MSKIARCINLDWLEIYALEEICTRCDADFFRSQGYFVSERDYGTRVYNEMFTLEDEEGHPWLEIRRNPKSDQRINGLFPPNACHIRLVNRQCYADNAVEKLLAFCNRHHYDISRVSRVDIALDFTRFDFGDDPQDFLTRYIKGKYAKINQANVHAHGEDTWTARNWHSVSWGSPKSMIGTKFYNKTMELKQVKDKPYIRQAWFESGLVDHPQELYKLNSKGEKTFPDVWRLEFSIRSSVKNWVVIEEDGQAKKYRSLRNTLTCYDTREKLLAMFASLTQHYFHFRIYRNGIRKWDCEQKKLFNFQDEPVFYKVEHPSSADPKNVEDEILLNRLRRYQLLHPSVEINQACETIIKAIKQADMARLMSSPAARWEILALQQTIAARLGGADVDPAALMKKIASQLEKNPDMF